MKSFQLKYSRFSETSILVQWPQSIAPEILNDILLFKNYLLETDSESIVQITNAYSSILISYKLYIKDIETKIALLKSKYESRTNVETRIQKLWKIPVCYDPIFALDLEEIARKNKLSISEIIQFHSGVTYIVYFIGFLPGFLYLGGLDKRLFMPRKTSPRIHIEKGAVAIGGGQTGIYPNASPGGWNIIGNSPISFFDPRLKKPCFASAGDSIQFVSVDLETYHEILSDAENYTIESEVLDG